MNTYRIWVGPAGGDLTYVCRVEAESMDEATLLVVLEVDGPEGRVRFGGRCAQVAPDQPTTT